MTILIQKKIKLILKHLFSLNKKMNPQKLHSKEDLIFPEFDDI